MIKLYQYHLSVKRESLCFFRLKVLTYILCGPNLGYSNEVVDALTTREDKNVSI